jgi:uncharacterized membrane protein YphA (DoxX/SURF4 family)
MIEDRQLPVDVLRWWVPLVFRLLVVWQLTWPALSKFVLYDSRVEHFRHDYGIPFPEVMVPTVGTFETVMVIAALFGIAGRIAAVPVIVIMLVAISTGGLNEGNVMVLTGSIGILLLGTGPLSLWDLRWASLNKGADSLLVNGSTLLRHRPYASIPGSRRSSGHAERSGRSDLARKKR